MTPADLVAETLGALRQAALRGDFAAFDGLAGPLATQAAALEAAPPDQPTLQALQRSAAELATLLQAVGQGLGAARRRLNEIESVRRGRGTYGGDGLRRTLGLGGETTRRV